MTKQEIISNWEAEIVKAQSLVELYHSTNRFSHMDHHATRRDTISLCLADIKKLNEAIVSGENKCDDSAHKLLIKMYPGTNYCPECGANIKHL